MSKRDNVECTECPSANPHSCPLCSGTGVVQCYECGRDLKSEEFDRYTHGYTQVCAKCRDESKRNLVDDLRSPRTVRTQMRRAS